MRKWKCMVCGGKVSRIGTKRCQKCYGKYISLIFKGRNKTKKHKEALRKAHLGKKFSKETKLKMSFAQHQRQGGEIRKKSKLGYITIFNPKHPYKMNGSGGRIFEHRLIMEKKIGRYLKSDEVVHHVNRIKHDNRPENLYITTKKEHRKIEVTELSCPKCKHKFDIRLF